MIKILNENEIAARLESALYSAGRPLTVEELIKATGTESRQKTIAVLDLIIKKNEKYIQSYRNSYFARRQLCVSDKNQNTVQVLGNMHQNHFYLELHKKHYHILR